MKNERHQVKCDDEDGIQCPGLVKRKWAIQEDVVISGMAGRFPQSDSIDEFWDHLMNGDLLVSMDSSRWPPGKAFLRHFSGFS